VGDDREKRATIEIVERFKAILGGEDGEAPAAELPFDARERFGKARAPVRGTVNGTEFRTTVAIYGGRCFVGFNRALRERAGIAIGDEVELAIELDDEPRTVAVPPALLAVLEEDEGARAAFERLPPSHRREYAEWIAEAKREETRKRRAAQTLERLRSDER
jgi:bifunctional DNA-binding transcriptional regulator/antitoxin component of YhaV-PrlF toxin-antitoxin module